MNGGKKSHENDFSNLDLRLLCQFWKLGFQNILNCVILKNNKLMLSEFCYIGSIGGNAVV